MLAPVKLIILGKNGKNIFIACDSLNWAFVENSFKINDQYQVFFQCRFVCYGFVVLLEFESYVLPSFVDKGWASNRLITNMVHIELMPKKDHQKSWKDKHVTVYWVLCIIEIKRKWLMFKEVKI